MAEQYVTNANRPTLDINHPTIALINPGRKAGSAKLTIPSGDLSAYIGAWAKSPGVARVMLDIIGADSDLLEQLATATESNTNERQVKMVGNSMIGAKTTEQRLDKMAVALIRAAFPGYTDGIPQTTIGNDQILTHLGFRTETCDDKIAFGERLVALQLIVRRGMEYVAERSAGQDSNIPIFIFTPASYNNCDWDTKLGGAETPGTGSPQKKSLQTQLEEQETDDTPDVGGDTQTNPAMVAAIQLAMTTAMGVITTRLDAMDKRQAELVANGPPAKKARMDPTGDASDLDLLDLNYTPRAPLPTGGTNPTTDTDPNRTADIFKLAEVDPGDSINVNVIPEIAKRHKERTRITAGAVFGFICSTDQTQRIHFSTGDDGSMQLARSTTSSRKIATFYELNLVTEAFIDSVYSVEPIAGFKLRQYFVQTINTANRNFEADLSKTVSYWNKHVFQWIKGIEEGINTKLTLSDIIQRDVEGEFRAMRALDREKEADNSAIKALAAEVRGLRSTNRTPTAQRLGPRVLTVVPSTMRDKECLAYLAGKDCRVVDVNSKCVFSHEGLVKGSNPDAQKDHYDKQKKR